MNVLAIIPARGGSKGIPRKNIRFMAGIPLIAYAINSALNSEYISDVFVSTDDNEIAYVAKKYGAGIIERSSELATDQITLDPVIHHAVNTIEAVNHRLYDVVVTIQPTSPLLTSETLDHAILDFMERGYDTTISSVNKPHLAWTLQDDQYVPLYEERKNRQYLPKHLMETGAFVITKRECITERSRIGERVSLFEVPENEAVDIDTSHDWWICEKELNKKRIVIRTDGFNQIGLGHIYRGILLANNLIDHDVSFILSRKHDLGVQKVRDSHFKYELVNDEEGFFELLDRKKPDIVINDVLNTTKPYIKRIKDKGIKVVNFEDLGEGADLADCVINALYDKQREGDHYYWGHEYFCLRDEFVLAERKPFSKKVRNVLVLFGGTDPSDFTRLTWEAIRNIPFDWDIKFTFILGMGYERYDEFMELVNEYTIEVEVVRHVKLMTEYMKHADMAISSQGRTMYELARMGVPTIILSQNKREASHMFGYMMNGFINLGMGSDLQTNTLFETVKWLIHAPQIRHEMHNIMKNLDLTKGIDRVKELILK